MSTAGTGACGTRNRTRAAQGGEVDGIVTTAWVPAVVASQALTNMGDKRIKMVGIDHDEVVLKAIKEGYVHGTMLQNIEREN